MAINSYQTYLMVGSGTPGTYSALCPIKSTPDSIMGNKNLLETTTLSDDAQTYIPGIRQVDSSGLQFTANYDYANFTTLNTRSTSDESANSGAGSYYAIFFGADSAGDPDGHDGKFEFTGKLSVSPNGVGVDEVVEMTITIAPTSPVSFA